MFSFSLMTENINIWFFQETLNMEISNLATLLKQTLDPAARERAEAELQNVRKIIGFCPGLLQVVMNNSIDAAVRQAGVIYFKNLVSSSWVPKVK